MKFTIESDSMPDFIARLSFITRQNIGLGFGTSDERDEFRKQYQLAYPHFLINSPAIFRRDNERIFYEVPESPGRHHHGTYFYVMKDNPGLFRGKKLRFVYLHNTENWKNLEEVKLSTHDCLHLGSIKFGDLLIS